MKFANLMFYEFFLRPWSAFISGVETLSQPLPDGAALEACISRTIHALSRPIIRRENHAGDSCSW